MVEELSVPWEKGSVVFESCFLTGAITASSSFAV